MALICPVVLVRTRSPSPVLRNILDIFSSSHTESVLPCGSLCKVCINPEAFTSKRTVSSADRLEGLVWQSIHGLVADLITVAKELTEATLGRKELFDSWF